MPKKDSTTPTQGHGHPTRNVPGQQINYRPQAQVAPAQQIKRNPTFTAKDDHEPTYNILTCIACAQQRGIDLVGLSPLEVQGQLGQGGQATVTQTRASVDTVLAFKKPSPKGVGSWLSTRSLSKKIENVYRDVATEVMALGELGIRGHPNIIQLQAISWEVQNNRTWTFKKAPRVWPVLLMERADHGDLQSYMATKEGSELSFEDKIEFCHGIASAIAAAHRKGIVHGDIKPKNVLVFEENNKPTVKLADFGFSAFASSKNLTLGGTVPWMAPEVQSQRSHTLSQAKKTDMFSFGLLVLWILFREQLEEKWRSTQTSLPPVDSGVVLTVTLRVIQRVTNWLGGPPAAEIGPDLQCLIAINSVKKSGNSARVVALQLVEDNIDDGSKWKKPLTDLLGQILQFDYSSRGGDAEFDKIEQLLAGQRPPEANEGSAAVGRPTTPFPPPSSFELSGCLQTICHADFRVRIFIFKTLLQEYKAAKRKDQRKKLGLQLAVCYKTGFGTDPNAKNVKRILDAQEISPQALDSEIEKSRVYRGIRSSQLLQKMERNGVIQPVHHGQGNFDIRSPQQAQKIVAHRTHEVEVMEAALGATHPAVLNLKLSLSPFLEESFRHDQNMEMIHQMVKDLEKEDQMDGGHAPTGECPRCRQVAITKSYRLLALMPLMGPHTIAEFAELAQRTDRELRILADEREGEHMAALLVCVVLSDIYATWGRFADSEPYLTRAITQMRVMFGDDHPNTVLLKEKEAQRLMAEGQFSRAANLLEATIEKLGTLIEADSDMVMRLRDMLVFMFLMSREFDKAEEVVEKIAKLAENHVPIGHPALVMPPFNVAMVKNQFEKAVEIARAAVAQAKRMGDGGGMVPGPQPSPGRPGGPELEEPPAAAKELLGEECFLNQVLDPKKRLDNPLLFFMQTMLVIALHALAWKEEGARNSGKADALKKEADGHLTTLLQHMNQAFGDSSWVDLSGRRGIEGSALRRAMDEEHINVLETLLMLGDKGMRDGIHYEWTIAQARRLKYHKLQKLLEEHHDICRADPLVPSPGQLSVPFRDAEELSDWITGRWNGAFLYGSAETRRDPKGHCSLELKARVCDSDQDDEVLIHGTVRDESGDRVATGSATLTGRINLRIRFPYVKEEAGWHYRGTMNRTREAIGGIWGMPDPDKQSAGGTFFFYKKPVSS